MGSTLAAESQALLSGLGQLAWTARLLSEAIDGFQNETSQRESMKLRGGVCVLDAKSVYDHLISPGSSGTLLDKLVAVDLAIVKQCLRDYGIKARWAPSSFQLGDCLTKASSDSCDTLRGVLQCGEYQLCDEKAFLDLRAKQRKLRKDRAKTNIENNEKKQSPKEQ